ncbi:transcriptional regulator GcvA [Parasphingorhabdus sp.]|uniref:transcriptional regulator GcvA n=1 Tax=Parasphingorhabdus sp. TaxID=2709688 RepID=UPI00329732D0
MSIRLPPLTALRAFDAAARHMSFAKAAEELNVTPAALSFQIKSLEQHLGAPLFHRLNRAVELTSAGEALSQGAAEGFQTLATAWRAAQRTQDTQTLTITAGPAFTAKWLAPRLYDFAQAHPEIELRFAASLQRMDLSRDNVDVAIRFGNTSTPELYSLPLADEWIVPVMTPTLAAAYPTVESLQKAPIIFDDSISFLSPPIGWPQWFEAMNAPFTPTQGPRFSQADHALDAALAGVGIVLGRRALVIKDLAEGRLVAPFPTALTTSAGFSFLCLKGMENRPQIAIFRDWILAEIEKTAHISQTLNIVKPA